jgi:hypothetical protein
MTQADSARALRMSLDLEPTGDGQAKIVSPESWARCILCSGPAETLVVIASYESASNSGVLKGCGYCASLLGKRVAA